MQLSLSQLKEITLGAARVEQLEDGFHFYRFTREQEELYKSRNPDLYMKSFATSGIRLRFVTDSKTLFMKTVISAGSSRTYFAFDLFVNGRLVDSLNNFEGVELPAAYTGVSLPRGMFSKAFALGDGVKEVCLYFPWSAKAVIEELTLDEGAYAQPVKPKYKAVCFGDSITQGYDALHPSNKYISRLMDHLDAQEYNKAIGAEVFFPALAATKEDFVPDYITVAYGSNDWKKCRKEEFEQNCMDFFRNLTANYPKTKIFVITPIWRKNHMELTSVGAFDNVRRTIEAAVKGCSNVVVIPGFELVPPEESLFADLRLHPTDQGFAYYYENLAKQIKTK